MALFTIDSTITLDLTQWTAAGYGDLTPENLRTYLLYTLSKDQNALPGAPLSVTILQYGRGYRIRAIVDITSPVEILGFGTRTDKQEAESVWRHAVADFSRLQSLSVKTYTPEPE